MISFQLVNFVLLLFKYYHLILYLVHHKIILTHLFFLDFIGHLDKNLIIMLLHREGKVNIFCILMIPHLNSQFSYRNVKIAHLFFGLG
jgi:hypothetical protein